MCLQESSMSTKCRLMLCMYNLFYLPLLRFPDYQESKATKRIATQLASNIYNIVVCILPSRLRLCGLMDKTPDFGSGDCRFKSCHFQTIFSSQPTDVLYLLNLK